MATKRKTKKRELLNREGLVSHWEMALFVHASDGRHRMTRDGRYYLHAKGTFAEAVGTVTGFDLMLVDGGEGLKEASAIGSIVGAKVEINAVVDLSPEEYAFAARLALSSRQCHMHMSFDKLHYGSGLIRSPSISTRPLDE